MLHKKRLKGNMAMTVMKTKEQEMAGQRLPELEDVE